jgi:hypothetical protein
MAQTGKAENATELWWRNFSEKTYNKGRALLMKGWLQSFLTCTLDGDEYYALSFLLRYTE